MKNQREIYEALLAGETLISSNGVKAKFNKEGELVSREPHNYLLEAFDNSGDWQIYKEPKWYENIPDGGVLCWVTDACMRHPEIIYKYVTGSLGPYKSTETGWSNAEPLTKQEIQVFMDNAPEKANGTAK